MGSHIFKTVSYTTSPIKLYEQSVECEITQNSKFPFIAVSISVWQPDSTSLCSQGPHHPLKSQNLAPTQIYSSSSPFSSLFSPLLTSSLTSLLPCLFSCMSLTLRMGIRAGWLVSASQHLWKRSCGNITQQEMKKAARR